MLSASRVNEAFTVYKDTEGSAYCRWFEMSVSVSIDVKAARITTQNESLFRNLIYIRICLHS